MRLLLPFTLLFLLARLSFGQTTLTYPLRGNLLEQNNAGPPLVQLDSGRFQRDTMPCSGEIRQVYHFGRNSGLGFNNEAARHWFKQSYTIELYFKMSDLSGWRRVVDFKNRYTDYGCYVRYGRLSFYNYIISDTTPFEENRYQYYAVTRDSLTNRVHIYSSGTSQISFVDTDTAGTISASQWLTFFQDDFSVPNEASSGALAYLKLYRQPLDSITVRSHFTNICSILGTADHAPPQPRLRVAPNPAGSLAEVRMTPYTGTWTYRLYASDGRLCREGESWSATLQLDLEGLPPGLYSLQAATPQGMQSVTLMRQ